MENEFFPLLLPKQVKVLIHIFKESNDIKIYFFNILNLDFEKLKLYSQFLFTYKLPDIILDDVWNNKILQIEVQNFKYINIEDCIFSFINDNHDEPLASIQFANSFYLFSFINQICLTHNFVFLKENCFSLIPIDSNKIDFSIPKYETTNQGDLEAHNSLVEFLNLHFSTTYGSANLNKFESLSLLKLLKNPNDPKELEKLSKSDIDPYFAPLIIIVLLIDSPQIEGEVNSPVLGTKMEKINEKRQLSPSSPLKRLEGMVTKPPPLKDSKRLIYAIDDLSIGGSSDISTDYDALKTQWQSITKRQLSHMMNLRISIRLLEESLLNDFNGEKNHPLLQIIFNTMLSHFLLFDKYETFLNEFYSILSALAHLFHPSSKTIDSNATEVEHLVFWLFNSLINKTSSVDIIENNNPAILLQKCFSIIMALHPLMYSIIDSYGIASLKFPMKVVYSLYSNVLSGPKLWHVWIAALSFSNPMDFFQAMMSMALMLIYPHITESSNIGNAIESHLTSFFEYCASDILVANTINLMNVYNINQ